MYTTTSTTQDKTTRALLTCGIVAGPAFVAVVAAFRRPLNNPAQL